MRIIAATSLAFLFLLQGMSINVDLCDKMEHIADFLSHYQIHKEYGGDTFIEYVGEEIFNDGGDKTAHHKDFHDDNTPEHKHHKCCHASVFVAPSGVTALSSVFVIQNVQQTHYSFDFNSRFLESLFQPPRA